MGDFGAIAGAIASAIPGGQAIGAGLGAISALQAGKKAQKKADKYASAAEAQAARQQEWLETVFQPMMKAYVEQYYNPQTGFSRMATDPYADVANPYDLSAGPLRAAVMENADLSTDAAIRQLTEDYRLSTGAVGGSSGLDSAIALLRSRQASDTARELNALGVKKNEFASGLKQQSIDAAFERVMSLMNAARGVGDAGSSSLGTMGGLAGMYQSRADQIGGNLAGAIGGVMASGANRRPRDAGDSTLSTNQSPTPIGGSPGTASPGFNRNLASSPSAVNTAVPILGIIQEEAKRTARARRR